MFTHCFLGTNNIERSRKFYDAALGALGYSGVPLPNGNLYPGEGGALIVATPANGDAHTVSNGHTLGFSAKSYAEVDAFHAGGLTNGGSCEGAPGVRESSPGHMYGAYLRDPDGNKICAFAPNAG